MEWIIEIFNCSKHVSSIGLGFDVIGAWLVGFEVVKKFKGEKFNRTPTVVGSSPPPEPTKEFKAWEKSHHKFMWVGLSCLTVGFSLQIYANYI